MRIRKKNTNTQTIWVPDNFIEMKPEGTFNNLIQEMRSWDNESFFRHMMFIYSFIHLSDVFDDRFVYFLLYKWFLAPSLQTTYLVTLLSTRHNFISIELDVLIIDQVLWCCNSPANYQGENIKLNDEICFRSHLRKKIIRNSPQNLLLEICWKI